MIGLLFSGQGSQKPAMGADLYEKYEQVKDFYDSLDLDFDIKDISFNSDEDTLKKTIFTQPSLVALHLGILRLLKSKGLDYSGVAGLSLGEYSALVAAGVISDQEAMEIIEQRAKYMSQSCRQNPSTLLALISKDEDKIYQVISKLRDQGIFIEIANLNCPGQIVVGVKAKDLDHIKDSFAQVKGIRISPLDVEGAFHTSLMEDAEKKLYEDLKSYKFEDPDLPIYMNRTGKRYGGEDFPSLMAEQTSHTTNFGSILNNMLADGISVFLEIGNNDIFKGFMKRIDRNIKVIPVNSVETIENLEEALND